MDFGAFPPEVNSTRMYAGAGSAPMLAAASAWKGLAAELSSTAASYQSVISGLTSHGWTGPASASMVAAVTPYVRWMAATAAYAEQTASQAYAAAAAYEGAFAMTVPPPVIAANRAQQASLVATNIIGQNTPAIAATEAHYGQMWAQDAGAMYGYAGESATAAQLAPFTAPPPTTNPAGQAGQTAAVTQAAGNAAATNTQTALSQFTSAVPPTLQSMAAPAVDTGSGTIIPSISNGDLANAMTNLTSSSFGPMGMAGITQAGADIAVMRGAAIAAGDPLGLGALDLPGLATPGLGLPGAGIPGMAGHGLGGMNGALSAGMGRATTIGALSVPQSWAAATPAANSALTPFPAAHWASAVTHAEGGGAPGVPGMPMAGLGSRGFGFAAPRYGFKPTVMARPVVAG